MVRARVRVMRDRVRVAIYLGLGGHKLVVGRGGGVEEVIQLGSL